MDGELTSERETERLPEPGTGRIHRSLPWLIISLVTISWAAFLYSLYKNNCPSKTARRKCLLEGGLGRLSFQPYEENPQFGPAGPTLVDLGGLNWNLKGKQAMKWHILSSIFLHTGLIDLILDTISLLYMGMELEQNFGIVKIGSLYFLSSLGGSLWASLKIRGAVYVGGSSGVCGITGGAFAELFINSNMHEKKLKRFRSLCFGVVINFAIKLSPRGNVYGNIGGLYLGFLLGFLLLIRRQPESGGYEYKRPGLDPQLILNYSRHQQVYWVIALVCTIIQFLYSLILYISH